MPGIMIKAKKEMMSPTTKVDADTYAVSTDDSNNDDSPYRHATEEAITSPRDKLNASLNIDVKGSVNSDVKHNRTSGINIEQLVYKEERPKDAPSISYVQGAEPKIDISVPAKKGETIMHVECTTNEMSYCCYRHYDGQERPFRSKWTLKNVPHGLIKIILMECPTFFELIDKLEEQYRSKFEKTHNESCLVVEFLHDTEEDRDRMMQDQEKVKTMFMEFLHGIGKDALTCSLEVCSEPATVNIRDEDVKEMITANPKDTQITNTSDSDSDVFFDATDKVIEDTDQAANLPARSLTEDAKEMLGLNSEGKPLTETSASVSESSLKLPPRSSDEKSELKKKKLPPRSSEEKSQHYKGKLTLRSSKEKSQRYKKMSFPRSSDGISYLPKSESTGSRSFIGVHTAGG